MTQRWKIVVEYDGAGLFGWQKQNDFITVQGSLIEALKHLTGEDAMVQGSGRTDAGVHALGQVAHFDIETPRRPKEIRDGLTHFMQLRGLNISVVSAEMVSEDFHARFSAICRHYKYIICNRYAVPVIRKGYVWHIRKKLDVEAMREAAQVFIGEHDFTSFRTVHCQAKSPIRTIERFDVEAQGDEVIAKISAPSFLHHQVRNFMGTLKKVGHHEWSVDKVRQVLEAKDRTLAGMTAPAEGLYFVQVDYND